MHFKITSLLLLAISATSAFAAPITQKQKDRLKHNIQAAVTDIENMAKAHLQATQTVRDRTPEFHKQIENLHVLDGVYRNILKEVNEFADKYMAEADALEIAASDDEHSEDVHEKYEDLEARITADVKRFSSEIEDAHEDWATEVNSIVLKQIEDTKRGVVEKKNRLKAEPEDEIEREKDTEEEHELDDFEAEIKHEEDSKRSRSKSWSF